MSLLIFGRVSESKPSQPKATGLGDVVAAVAQPIAKVIDRMAGTKIAKCGGCARRREKLNKSFPFKTYQNTPN